MDWKLFLSTFALIFVAELPDKTAFATLLMATRGNPFALFIGVAAAFVIQSIVAVCFGSVIGLISPSWIRAIAGIAFLVFAVLAWRRSDHAKENSEIEGAVSDRMTFSSTVWKSFLIIFIAEWGDLTQLATASLAARYHDPVSIFFAAVLSLWLVTALAIFAGHKLKHIIHPRLLDRFAAVAFAGVGLFFIFSVYLAQS